MASRSRFECPDRSAVRGPYRLYRKSIRYYKSMSTSDRLLSTALHGTAIRYAAEKRNLAESIAELREIACGRDDILAEVAGTEAGRWYASPAVHAGYQLVAAGMLIMAAGHEGKPMDYNELERWTRVGYERGIRSRMGEG
jgi:hypothetical protein